MHVRKEVYQIIAAEIESKARQWDRQVRENAYKLRQLGDEQRRLKAKQKEAHRLWEEFKGKSK